jgi:hypothetical protein
MSQFGKAIVCSDAAAEAARYGFTAVDRPEGYLVLAVASLGEEITEVTATPGAEVRMWTAFSRQNSRDCQTASGIDALLCFGNRKRKASRIRRWV